MARIRTIKPEFFTSEDIVILTPLSRLFYVSLWCESDREGRLEWKPKTFKLRYFPADDCDIEAMGNELIENKLIEIYEVDGKKFAQIPGFKRHQVINNRESESVIPEKIDASPTRESGVKAEGKEGREGKGREGKARKTRIPKNFDITDRVKKWANEKGHNRLEDHLENFKIACNKNGYEYVDWDSAFMGAVRDDWAKLKNNQVSQGSKLKEFD